MKLIPDGEPVRLEDLPAGSLFMFGDTMALKSEYRVSNGAIEAFIVGTGEMFWGGTSKPHEQVAHIVQPLKVMNTD